MPKRAEERQRGTASAGAPARTGAGAGSEGAELAERPRIRTRRPEPVGAGRAESAADRSAHDRGRLASEPAACARREQRRGELFNQYRRREPRPPKRQLKVGAGPELVGGRGLVPRHGAPEHRFSRVTAPVVTTSSEWRRPLRGPPVQYVSRRYDLSSGLSTPMPSPGLGGGICIYHCCNIKYV